MTATPAALFRWDGAASLPREKSAMVVLKLHLPVRLIETPEEATAYLQARASEEAARMVAYLVVTGVPD